MEQNANQDQQTPEPKEVKSNFKIIALLAALSWIIFPIGLVAAIISAIYLHVKGRHKESRAIWAGLGIGFAIIVIVLGVTCFALSRG